MNTFLKNVSLFIVIAGGIITGIVVGYKMLGEQKVVVANRLAGDLGIPDEMKLIFSIGDVFPLIELETINGAKIKTSEILAQVNSGIIITSFTCGPCDDFLVQWNQMVSPKLKSNTQEILLITYEEVIGSRELPKLIDNKRVFHFLRKELEDKINATNFPTALAVDENGKVIGIQYGRQEGINYDILKFLTTHDI